MLFQIISTPVPTRPSEVREQRKSLLHWFQDLKDKGIAQSFFLRAGRGAVVVFDVDSHEELTRLLNHWSDAVPAEFEIYPLMEPESAMVILNDSR